jgi:diguanylate cyclase (GGDEF)-like protein
MADHTIHLVTGDEALLASTRAAVSGLEGWSFRGLADVAALLEDPPVPGDGVLLDGSMRTENVYEACRRLVGRTRCRTWVITEGASDLSAPIARFCGATGALARPLTGATMRTALEATGGPARDPAEKRGAAANALAEDRELPQEFLEALLGNAEVDMIAGITDPETGLYNYEFLRFKLDEEFKRAQRFQYPLSCVRLGFEGQADDEVLRALASIFLVASRDTDVLGRFDQSSFLFLLPHTGPDGASIMAKRISALAEEQGLRDLVGDPLEICVGISSTPNPSIERRDDLFSEACEAYETALREGGVTVAS